MSREPALLTSAGRMPERSQHRVSEGLEGLSARPATGHGQPRTAAQWHETGHVENVLPRGDSSVLFAVHAEGQSGTIPP